MKENLPHIYRLVRNQPLLMPQKPSTLTRTPSRTRKQLASDLVSTTMSMLNQDKFIYLDLQDNSNIKMMERAIGRIDSEEATERLGDLCITNLGQLSKGSQQMYRYLDRLKIERGKQQEIDHLVADRISPKTSKPSTVKSPTEMSNQVLSAQTEEIQEFLEHRRKQKQDESLFQFQEELVKKVGPLSSMSPVTPLRDTRYLNSKPSSPKAGDSDRHYSALKDLFSKIKDQRSSPKKRCVNLPTLVNRSLSLDLRPPKKRLMH